MAHKQWAFTMVIEIINNAYVDYSAAPIFYLLIKKAKDRFRFSYTVRGAWRILKLMCCCCLLSGIVPPFKNCWAVLWSRFNGFVFGFLVPALDLLGSLYWVMRECPWNVLVLALDVLVLYIYLKISLKLKLLGTLYFSRE